MVVKMKIFSGVLAAQPSGPCNAKIGSESTPQENGSTKENSGTPKASSNIGMEYPTSEVEVGSWSIETSSEEGTIPDTDEDSKLLA